MTDKPATLKQLQEIEAAAKALAKEGKAGGSGTFWDSSAYNAAEARLTKAIEAVDSRLDVADQFIDALENNKYVYARSMLGSIAAVAPKSIDARGRTFDASSVMSAFEAAAKPAPAADLVPTKTPSLEQMQAVEAAAIRLNDYFSGIRSEKITANSQQSAKLGKALIDAIEAAGGKREWGKGIIDAVNTGKPYSRAMLNGAKGYDIQGYAQMLDTAERAAGQTSLVSIVGRGVPIDADGTNAAHDGARKETARVLESWLTFTYEDKTTVAQKYAKQFGLKDGETLDIIDGKGKLNRANLDKALRAFQAESGLVVDGRIGSTTADYLLFTKDEKNATGYGGGLSYNAVFGKQGAYLCGKTLSCDLQNYKDGTEKDKDADARNKIARDGIVAVRGLIEGLKTTVISDDNLAGKNLTDAEKKALKTFSDGVTADKNLTADEIKAFQTAFGLEADGIVGRKTLAAVNQVNLRLAAHEVIDPSEIRAAVQTQTGGSRRLSKLHS